MTFMPAHNCRILSRLIRGVGLVACVAVMTAISAATVRAQDLGNFPYCDGCGCENAEHQQTRAVIVEQEMLDRQYIREKFIEHQNWLTDDFYKQWVMPAMKLMAEELAVNGMNQMMALGGIFDAKEQLDTQRLLQQHMAEAHKDYQTSTEVCVMGTAQQHIASTERRAALATHVLSKHSLDRQLGNLQSAAADGPEQDSISRLDQVRSQYCNPNDNFKQMKYICDTGGPQGRRNRDIDFARIMGDSMTLDIDMENTGLTNDEQDVMALQSYLYVNHPFSRISPTLMQTQEGQELWMAMRSVMAKHMVAENSFDNIIGMKAASGDDTTDTGKLISVVYKRMGLTDDEAQKVISRSSSVGTATPSGPTSGGYALNKPSYYATLQTLSQALYQNPEFYVNLYDTPANVDRKAVAMQAVNLLLDRETYNSELREEAVLSQILEAEVVKAQERHENALNNLKRNERMNPAVSKTSESTAQKPVPNPPPTGMTITP